MAVKLVVKPTTVVIN